MKSSKDLNARNDLIHREQLLTRISNLTVVAISIILLLIYAFSLGKRELSPPSVGTSNAILLFSADYGFSKINPGHVALLSNGREAAIASVDGERIRMGILGAGGALEQSLSIPVDLSNSRIFFLHSPDSEGAAPDSAVDADGGSRGAPNGGADSNENTVESFQPDKLALVAEGGGYPGIWHFPADGPGEQIRAAGELLQVEGDYALFREDGGLYALDLNRRNSEPLALIQGRVLSYASASRNEGLHAAAVVESGTGIREIVHSFLPRDSQEQPVTWNMGPAAEDELENLMDIHVSGETLSMLFLYRDKRFGVNRISALQWSLPLHSTRKNVGMLEMPFYRSKYRILNARENSVEFNAQVETPEGVNIAGVTMNYNAPPDFRLLSKTRSMSKFAGSADMGHDTDIIFYDVENEKRQLYLASSDPALIERSMRIDGSLIAYVAGMTLAMTLSAGGLGLIFLFTIMVAASLFLTTLLSTRFTNPRLKAALPAAAGVVLHIGISLIILNFLMNETAHLSFKPAVGGGSQAYFLVSLFLSLTAAGLSLAPYAATRFRECSAGSLYLRFFIYQFVFYTLHMGVYVASSMILTHI